jgi:hypothetical protein
MDIQVGDRVRLRKAHPCGSAEWIIYRVGADVGLRCTGCGRRVMLTRSELSKRLKQSIPVAKEIEN